MKITHETVRQTTAEYTSYADDKHAFVCVTMWANGEGFDAKANEIGVFSHFQLTWQQWEALKKTVKASLEHEEKAPAKPPQFQDTGELPDPIQVLHELFEAGNLEDHFYAIRKSEGRGWDGPRMKKWGKACEQAQQLLKNR